MTTQFQATGFKSFASAAANRNGYISSTVSRIETLRGEWTSYGNDGRLTTERHHGEEAGTGWRARFTDNVHGGDYAWGDLGNTEIEAVCLLLMQEVSILNDLVAEATRET